MSKTTIITLCLLFCVQAALASRPQAILGPGTGGANFRVPYHETTNRLLSKDTTYILTGWYFIDSTYSITIEAGTLIRGDSASGGSLIIKRGAQIFAQGTPTRPIVFTSNKPSGTRAPGDWGGVILQGRSVTNQPSTTQAEGGFGTIPNTDAMYGGSDPNDNSGIMEYVRIEFAGIAYSQDNEINGLTLCAVGRGTTLDHIQVSFANDDDVEMFGGTVDLKYYIGWRMLDDDIDTDMGWYGRIQFAYEVRDPSLFDASAAGSSEGFESDGEPPPVGGLPGVFPDLPHTGARVSNVTMIGPQPDTSASVNSKWTVLARLRRGTYFSVYNSILTSYPQGINVRDTVTERNAANDSLQIVCTSIATRTKPIFEDQSPATGNISGFDVVNWFNGAGGYPATGNIGGTSPRRYQDIGIKAAAFNLDLTNDGVPLAGSEADVAGTSYQGRLAADAFFDSVSYRGAFDPSKPRDQQWDAGWSNYDPENYDPETEAIVVNTTTPSWNMISYPFREDTPAPTAVYPTAVSQAFAYTGSYQTSATLGHTGGYWLKFPGVETTSLRGNQNTTDTVHGKAHWNIIGSLTVAVTTASIVQEPPDNVKSAYFSYTGSSYSVASTIDPGRAYWVKLAADGDLILSGTFPAATPKETSILDRLTPVTISDAKGRSQTLRLGNAPGLDPSFYELPPAAPGNGFDVRFASGSLVALPSPEGATVLLANAAYPVAITTTRGPVEVGEIVNGRIAARRTGTSLRITNPAVQSLVLTLNGAGAIPAQFALGAAYPNPFNPTTRFNVDVPEAAPVEVSVYNLLGEKVATLLSGMTPAGSHTIQWNAENDRGQAAPSGIYFVRMQSPNFSAVRKIMLMK